MQWLSILSRYMYIPVVFKLLFFTSRARAFPTVCCAPCCGVFATMELSLVCQLPLGVSHVVFNCSFFLFVLFAGRCDVRVMEVDVWRIRFDVELAYPGTSLGPLLKSPAIVLSLTAAAAPLNLADAAPKDAPVFV